MAIAALIPLLMASIATSLGVAAGQSLSWQPWLHLVGVFDLAGPRSDGQLVANAGGHLFLLAQDGTTTPFAQAAGGYADTSGSEAYLEVSTGLHVSAANCDFPRDQVFIIRPTSPIGVTRVDADGHATNFVTLNGIDSLNGIVFDRTGGFDHRLLVTGPHHGHTVLIAIDCNGNSQRITDSAPVLEGGLVVAPATFGVYAGDLIAPDELSGSIWAIAPSGSAALLTSSGIRHGQDIGVESEGFVPSGFAAGGWAYLADRSTPGNPHPGTDTILRLPSSQLKAAGVHGGDLLIGAEGGAVTIDVRCAAACVATTLVPQETSAHVEGHLLVLATHPTIPQAPSTWPIQIAIVLFAVASVAVLLAVLVRRR